MDCVGYSELWWWASEGILKQGHRAAAEQPREGKSINEHFFPLCCKAGTENSQWKLEEFKIF